MRSFFSFRKFGRLLVGEPLVGVEASTVGADLCVRPSSPERSLFCGRTRRSAPTQATSARQFHSSNAVTSLCFLSSYASKKRSFFSFRELGRPLGGVGAPTVGADLCVRPSSPERSLFCGRTRRSAPTQATSARQFHSSNAVTSICRGGPACPPAGYTALQRERADTQVRPYKWLLGRLLPRYVIPQRIRSGR